MVRPLRIEYPGAVYHITSRGNARQNIYLDDEDRVKFLNILSKTVVQVTQEKKGDRRIILIEKKTTNAL